MEDLKMMKKSLISCVQAQINGNLKEVDTEELGEAVDMIKDLEEAIYYATITKAMEGQEREGVHSQQQPMYYPPYYNRDIDRPYGRMYYDDNGRYNMGDAGGRRMFDYDPIRYVDGGMSPSGGAKNYQDGMIPPFYEYPMEIMRDQREGRSPMSRKNYMEAKEKSHDSATHLKELEKYLQELSQDVTEMIQKATPEEKQLLQQKISLLATKIK